MMSKLVDDFYNYIEDHYCLATMDELLGKKYVIGKQKMIGSLSRMIIEEGVEIAKSQFQGNMMLDFDNRQVVDDIFEIGFCYKGTLNILALPEHEEYKLSPGDLFIYKTMNDVQQFQFDYRECEILSVHINFNVIKGAFHPILGEKLLADWQKRLNYIFKEQVLIIEKANYQLEKIAHDIADISVDDVMAYIKLKQKTIEFLVTYFEDMYKEKIIMNKGNEEKERVKKAKDLIVGNLGNPPSVAALAAQLNVTIYKLQQAFKKHTGSTVYGFIKRMKMDKAKSLLEHTNMSVMEIANEIGYDNPSKFASTFKQIYFFTPLQYRKQQRDLS
ncbi:helix-turn-helix domain-containing protein [Bacillus sp. Hm123]|uniref:helix-turn-helix domain-containing protein n=1 Tax=Bacillus sp. Hm123 TaxID=3450745 RepID=UPI003F435504